MVEIMSSCYPRPLSHVVATNNIVRFDRWTVGFGLFTPGRASKRLLCSVDGDIMSSQICKWKMRALDLRRCSMYLRYP